MGEDRPLFGKLFVSITLPGNPRAIAFSGIFHTGGTALWWPLFSIFLFSEGIGVLTIALVVAVGLGLGMVGAPLGGILADRGKRKDVILLASGCMLGGTALILIGLVANLPTLPSILVGFGLFSIGGTFGTGATRAILFESVSESQRGIAMSSPYVLPSLVSVPMPFIGSLIGQGYGWAWVFLIATLFLGMALVIKWWSLREPSPESPMRPSMDGHKTLRPKGWSILAPILPIIGVYGLVSFGQQMYGPFLPLYFTRYLGAPVNFYGLLASIELGMMGVLAFVSGKLVDRLGALRTATLSFAGEAVAVAVMVFVRNVLLAGGLYEVWGAIGMVDTVSPAVFIGASVSRERRATTIGSFSVATRLPGLAGPALGGVLFEAFPPFILIVYSGIVAVACFGTWWTNRHFRHLALQGTGKSSPSV